MDLFGDFLGIRWEFYRNSLEILSKFFGNSIGNFVEILKALYIGKLGLPADVIQFS